MACCRSATSSPPGGRSPSISPSPMRSTMSSPGVAWGSHSQPPHWRGPPPPPGSGRAPARVVARNVPLLIHPGRSVRQGTCEASLTEPLWWRALTDYVAQMQAAWMTFTALGRREHPQLTVLFAMLAGGAPLLSERLTSRGGPAIDLRDPRVFYDTSSYGPAAVDAMARCVGAGQLVYGS